MLFIGHIGMWLSLVEHYVRDVGAAGSNPVIPTMEKSFAQEKPKGFSAFSPRKVFNVIRFRNNEAVFWGRIQ